MKLTKGIKEKIARRVVEDLFIPSLSREWKSVLERLTGLVMSRFEILDWKCFEVCHDFIQWDRTVVIEKLPVEWLRPCNEFRAIFNTPRINYTQLDTFYPAENGCRIHMSYEDADYQERIHDILYSYVVAVIEAYRYYTEFQQVLCGLGTYKQLETVIPECAKYLPSESASVTALMPIAQINRVRSVLQKDGKV
jgi:hypothetical protein